MSGRDCVSSGGGGVAKLFYPTPGVAGVEYVAATPVFMLYRPQTR